MFRAREVDTWTEIQHDTIRQSANGPIYDSPDLNVREEIVDLATLPMEDGTGRDVRIYDANGRALVRAQPSVKGPPLGVLLDLTRVSDLFAHSGDVYSSDRWAEQPEPPPVGFNVYPLGFLGGLGNIQAKGITSQVQRAVEKLNYSILCDQFDLNDDQQTGSPIIPPVLIPPITGDATQAYSLLAHRTRQSDSSHDVTRGFGTRAAMESYALSVVDKRRVLQLFVSRDCRPDVRSRGMACAALRVATRLLRARRDSYG
jgi:hypothetical protein